ncbi:HAMP domain-containing sensor histidine kinase [Asticcacaulis sp. BYS171W]|uniref:histidine kinase n=1 Tax=Asticcacaulis aquaticus TaxID=2984212 RepID=A0ABT5HUP4_9CAUL|nr:HAMP domain-containing sensor histidine kinase [Asticcacaulis aquaticus]MDC7683570.1 HAMP domain-containing sensor histidine kinase [Asticcacaulis aquaticus]
MPFKSYFQDLSRTSPLAATPRRRVRLGVIVWHLGWSAVTLAALLGLLFLPASPRVLGALVVAALPGVSSIFLLTRDGHRARQMLVWIWGLACLIAIGLTGGIFGPLAAWAAAPMAAAVALNQRRLILLGATLSVTTTLFAILLSLARLIDLPDLVESFWLSSLAVVTLVSGFGLALLPALRARTEMARGAEDDRARFLKILSEQPHLIVALGDDGRLISAHGEAPLGLDMPTLMKHGLIVCAHVPDRLGVMQAIDEARVNGRAETGFMPHAALEHYVRLSLRRGSDGRLYGVLADASLHHAREEALESARFEAENLNQGKSRFLASMSHELRTPLNAVIGFSDIMRQQLFGPLSEKYTEYAQLIWESGQHVLDLVNDVLDMSKIEAQRYDLSLETFDAREPVSGALRLIFTAAHDKGVAVRSVLPPTPVEVTADKRALKQMCLNLLSNAVKFTPRGGSVTLILSDAGADGIDVQITDTGIGIAAEDLQRLGKPYEQTGPMEQRVLGTGLGLSLVQALAGLHKGRMSLESELGKGTSVSLFLPIAAHSDQPELPLSPPVSPPVAPEAPVAVSPETPRPLEDRLYTPPDLSGSDFVIRPPKS